MSLTHEQVKKSNTQSIYRTWLIVPVANYNDGLTDWQVYPEAGEESGILMHRVTLGDVHESIDEKINEAFTDEFGTFDNSAYNIAERMLHEDFISKALPKVGYKYSSDSVVLNDRYRALSKLTNTELLNIINR